jgi:L-serine dehydratase
MESLRELYRVGVGPSSSHTIGPHRAALQFRERHRDATTFRVTLYASLAQTGRGHLTDEALRQAFSPLQVELLWRPDEALPFHPNAMELEALDTTGRVIGRWQVYSVGGGALREGTDTASGPAVFPLRTMDAILERCDRAGTTFWEHVQECEGDDIWPFLRDVWHTMQAAIERGLKTEGVLPGGLSLPRKARAIHSRAILSGSFFERSSRLFSYALAVAEENASQGRIATAPTCGACGVVPAVLRYAQESLGCDERPVLQALATAGLIGNLVKHNASISGAEVGCQGEIGTACAMAAAAATQLFGGSVRQIEYAAEMGLEHHLGLTCDPVAGLVQIPCIERNAFAATRALGCAEYALVSDGSHRISFDVVVQAMRETGHDLPHLYRETSTGGLAAVYTRRPK